MEELDVEQVMERIRENIRRRRSAAEGSEPSRGLAPPSDGQVAADLALLQSGYDVYTIHLTSHRRLLGSFVVLVKDILRRLLTPILTRQVGYNAANARVAGFLKGQIDGMGEQLDTVSRQQAQLWEELLGARERLEAFGRQQMQLHEEVQNGAHVLREQLSKAERELRRVLYVLTDGQEEASEAGLEPNRVPRQLLKPDFDYAGFEERFRGSEEEIKERQRSYVDYFKGQDDVLDIGCGRGEFLELLREAGVQARGVDLDLDMVLHCRERGLEVARKDAFAYLAGLPDGSLGGVFAAQVIEHLESSQIIRLVKLCHQKLRPGGVLILETPNPACLMVFAESFYQDLSHIRPIHPAAMKFLVEATGFQDVQVKFSSPVEASRRIPRLPGMGIGQTTADEFNKGIDRLNELLFGFQDYAVIGRKS